MFPSLRLVTAALFATVLLAFTFVFVSARMAYEATARQGARSQDTTQRTMVLSRDLVFLTATPERVTARTAKPSPVIGTYVVTPPETIPSSDVDRDASKNAGAEVQDASKDAPQNASHGRMLQEKSGGRATLAPPERSGVAFVASGRTHMPSSDSVKTTTRSDPPAPAEEKIPPVAAAPDPTPALVSAAAAPGQTENAKSAGQPGSTDSRTAPSPESTLHQTAEPTSAESKKTEPQTVQSKTIESKTTEAKADESKPAQSKPQFHNAESKPAPAPAAIMAAPARQTPAIASDTAALAPTASQARRGPSQDSSGEASKSVALLENQTALPADNAATLADAGPNEVVPDFSAAGTIANVPLPKAKPALKTIRSAAASAAKSATVKRPKAKARHIRKSVRRLVRRQSAPPMPPPPAPQPQPQPTGYLFGN